MNISVNTKYQYYVIESDKIGSICSIYLTNRIEEDPEVLNYIISIYYQVLVSKDSMFHFKVVFKNEIEKKSMKYQANQLIILNLNYYLANTLNEALFVRIIEYLGALYVKSEDQDVFLFFFLI